jgi:hypothetical protein
MGGMSRRKIDDCHEKTHKGESKMKIQVDRMQASVSGEVTTLTQTAGAPSPHPPHLSPTSIVITLTANTAEFFQNAATGARYLVTIDRQT